MLEGKVSAALKWVTERRSGLLEANQKVVDELLMKHPKAEPMHNDVALEGPHFLPPKVTYHSIDAQAIYLAAKNTNGAAGPSGIDADGWKRFLCSRSFGKETSNLCLAISEFTRKVASENQDPDHLSPFTAARLIPLDKGDGNHGVRPIGIMEVLRRIVGKAIIKLLKYDVAQCDAPVRCVENGSNKSGPFRNPTLLEKFPIDEKQYFQIMNFDHMTFEKMTKHANKGGFFDNPENHGKSLQDLTDSAMSAKELIKIRWPRKQTENMSTEEIKEFLKNDLGGTRRPPIYFMMCPSKSPAEIGLDGAELVAFEPLHDLKGVTTKSLKLIPGPQEDATLKCIYELINNSCNFDFDSKHEKSGETVMKNLIEVVQKFELKYFKDGLNCNNCGKIFTMSIVKKCPKCLYYTYFRSLLEIHIFGYKDDSKRTGCAALLLNNLIFVLFKSLKEITVRVPDVSKIMNSIYFIDIVMYMGPTFELTNFLSVHAGSMEDLFRQIKNNALSFTNRKHFHESFLLNVLKRSRVIKPLATVTLQVLVIHRHSTTTDLLLPVLELLNPWLQSHFRFAVQIKNSGVKEACERREKNREVKMR
ncbi:hypothetical protein ACHWQZ_G007957 [Mnemiopsis leidyi]